MKVRLKHKNQLSTLKGVEAEIEDIEATREVIAEKWKGKRGVMKENWGALDEVEVITGLKKEVDIGISRKGTEKDRVGTEGLEEAKVGIVQGIEREVSTEIEVKKDLNIEIMGALMIQGKQDGLAAKMEKGKQLRAKVNSL